MPGGELHIHDVHKEDSKNYRCRTLHRLTGESKLSNTAGRLIVSGKLSVFNFFYFLLVGY